MNDIFILIIFIISNVYFVCILMSKDDEIQYQKEKNKILQKSFDDVVSHRNECANALIDIAEDNTKLRKFLDDMNDNLIKCNNILKNSVTKPVKLFSECNCCKRSE